MPDAVHTCPADHQHAANDTLTCYAQHRCRCAECSDLARAYDSWRNHMNATGQPLMVDATGTRRRLQALMALGWSLPAIAERLGDRGPNVRRLLSVERLTRRFADRIATVYDALCMTRPAGHDRTSNAAIARTRIFAARRGWLPPLAWDDIDTDPEPVQPGSEDVVDVDDIAIELACKGRPVRLTPAERRACVAILHEKRYSDPLIAETIRCNPKTVGRIREELHLPAHDQDDDVITRSAA